MKDINLISARGTYRQIELDTPFEHCTKAIWLTAPGDVSFVGGVQEDAQVLPGVPANQWVPLNAKQINSEGTTASIALVLHHCCH